MFCCPFFGFLTFIFAAPLKLLICNYHPHVRRTWMHEAQMYKGIRFLATQNTFKNCTKLGTIYVMRQIWQSRDNMWSQWIQWVEIRLKVAFHFFVDMCLHKIFMHSSCYNSMIKMKSYWVCHYYGEAEKNPLGTHEVDYHEGFWLFVFCQIQQFAKLAFAESFRD